MSALKLLTDSAVKAWKQQIERTDELFAGMSDTDLEREVAPGRNRVFYLLGHLTAVHDRMLPLLGLGERLHPELDKEFLTEADTHTTSDVAAQSLRASWNEVNARLTNAIESLAPEAWLERHTAVSPEDFAADPLRNRLSVLLNRTGHVAFHLGQIRLTTK